MVAGAYDLLRWAQRRLRMIADDLCAHAARQDPQAALQYAILRQQLLVTSSALMDEGLGVAAYQRIIDKIVYGCLPQAHEAEQRLDRTRLLMAAEMADGFVKRRMQDWKEEI